MFLNVLIEQVGADTTKHAHALSLSDWAAIAQIGAMIVAAAGIIVSMWLTRRTLAEVQTDRHLRHRPYLTFERGGQLLGVKFVRGGRFVPGVNRRYAESVLGDFPLDGESIVLADRELDGGRIEPLFYGTLKNYGAGAALNVHVTWKAKCVWISAEKFELDDKKKAEPLYGEALNRMPTIPSHIEPGEGARLSRLPAFIVKDHARKISRVDGELEISCRDVFGVAHSFRQEVSVWPEYAHTPPRVGVTFSDEILDNIVRAAAT